MEELFIANRGGSAGENLKNFEVRVGDSTESAGNDLCGTTHSAETAEIKTVSCGGLQGRYLSISIPGDAQSLSLCEVAVYGSCKLPGRYLYFLKDTREFVNGVSRLS